MIYYKTIGELLEDERKKKGLSVRELCRGLCAPSTYVRYENDILFPDYIMLQALIERLGLNPNEITYIANKVDLDIINRREEINDLIADKNIKNAKERMDEYIHALKKNENIHKQFIQKSKADIYYLNNDKQKAKDLYYSAIILTQNPVIQRNRCFSLIEFELWFKYLIVEDDEEDFKWLEQYLYELDDMNILKTTYYTRVVQYYVSTYSIENTQNACYIDKALEYVRNIGQTKELSNLLNIKIKYKSLSEDEEYIRKNLDLIEGDILYECV